MVPLVKTLLDKDAELWDSPFPDYVIHFKCWKGDEQKVRYNEPDLKTSSKACLLAQNSLHFNVKVFNCIYTMEHKIQPVY